MRKDRDCSFCRGVVARDCESGHASPFIYLMGAGSKCRVQCRMPGIYCIFSGLYGLAVGISSCTSIFLFCTPKYRNFCFLLPETRLSNPKILLNFTIYRSFSGFKYYTVHNSYIHKLKIIF